MTTRSGWHRKRTDDPASQRRAAEYRSPAYKAARAAVKVQVDAGYARCWRCGKGLIPGQWHLGHNDDWTHVMGGECARCNLRAAASKGARVANARRKARTALTW